MGLVNLEELTLAENPIQDMSSLCQLLARNPDLGVDITPQNCDEESAKIYWGTFDHVINTEILKFADLDGGNQRVLHTARDVSLSNLVVDGMRRKIYWIAFDKGTRMESLESADLDGGNPQTLHTARDASLSNLVVDGMRRKIYWIAFDKGTRMESLESADLDGGNPQTLHTVQSISLSNLVVDGMNGKIYWIADDRGTEIAKLESADLNGGNRQTLFSSPNSIFTFAVATSPIDISPGNVDVNPGNVDVNTDGVVNIQDLVVVSANLGQTGENIADVNTDGVVNIQDLVLVAAAFGNTAAAPDILHLNTETALTKAEVTQWLQDARQLDLTDPTFQHGIRFLEHLLAVLTPKETALLPNYPNPFNPETWIPYQLAEPAAVALAISDIQGRVVRLLDLGHQRAGIYQHRVRAAYWDGRNAQGEPVASGVYFYTFTAGDFTATRKMLIRK